MQRLDLTLPSKFVFCKIRESNQQQQTPTPTETHTQYKLKALFI